MLHVLLFMLHVTVHLILHFLHVYIKQRLTVITGNGYGYGFTIH